MKIDPDTPFPLPQLATPQSAPSAPGDASIFEALLASPAQAKPAREVAKPLEVGAVQGAGRTPTPTPSRLPIRTVAEPPRVASSSEPPFPVVEKRVIAAAAEPKLPRLSKATPGPATPASVTVSTEKAPADGKIPERPSEPKPDPRPPRRPVGDRAFDFGELGVWGHGPRVWRDGVPAQRTCGVEPGAAKGEPARGERDSDRASRIENSNRPARSDLHSMEPDDAVKPERSARRATVSKPLLDTPLAAAPAESDREARLSERETHEVIDVPDTPRRALATPDASASVSVSVAGDAGAVQVAAAASHLVPEAVARLRRIAESLAREFGLSLAGFSLNGERLDLSSRSEGNHQWR